jgi:hypothetical protein
MSTINLNSTEWRQTHGVRGGLEPDSGNPTVRDHREALGNTAMEELGTRFTNRKSENGNSLPKVLVRSVSIPLTQCFILNVSSTRRFKVVAIEKPLKRLLNSDDP